MPTTLEQHATQHPKALWDRYFELSNKAEPTDAELAEASRLKAKLQLPPGLADLLLTEAERLEALIRQEPRAVAEEQAAFSAAYKQNLRVQCIMEGIGSNIEYRPQDTERHHAARLLVESIEFAKRELAQMYRHWPEVFGLPAPGSANNSDHISGLPTAVQSFMTANGLRIPEHISPHRAEFNAYDIPDDAPQSGDVTLCWTRKTQPGTNNEI